MNSLSWMIYAAETVEKLGNVSTVIAIMAAIGYPTTVFLTAMAVDMHDMTADAAAKWRRLPIIFGLAALPFAVLTPSSNTVYLIAASEAGETIVKSREAKDVFDDLKTIIKSKLKEQLPKI